MCNFSNSMNLKPNKKHVICINKNICSIFSMIQIAINQSLTLVNYLKKIIVYVIIYIDWFSLVVFNATFNNISVTSWQSVLLWRKPKYLQKTTNLSQVTDKLYVVSSTTLHERGSNS